MSAATEVRAVLEDEAASVGPHSADFWVLAAALKRFIDGEGQGSLPLEVINLLQTLLRCHMAHSTRHHESRGPLPMRSGNQVLMSEDPLWSHTDTSAQFFCW